jgi:hypothetical protein
MAAVAVVLALAGQAHAAAAATDGGETTRIVAPPPPADDRGFQFRLDVAGDYRYALEESWGAAALGLYFGGQGGRVSVSGTQGFTVGRSRAGLTFWTLHWGVETAWKLGRGFRLGFEPHLGAITVERATHNGAMSGFLIGLSSDLTYDLVRWPKGGLFLLARVGYDFVDTRPDLSYAHSASLHLGLGFRR